MKRHFYFLIIAFLLVSFMVQSPAYGQYDVKDSAVYINGAYLGQVDLLVVSGRALVPLALLEDFGFAISRDPDYGIAVIEDGVYGNDTQYSSAHFWWAICEENYLLLENDPVDGWQYFYFDELGYPVAPYWSETYRDLYVPLRLFVQIMGGDVDYYQGDINFNLPNNVLDDIDYRYNNSKAATQIFQASQDVINCFYD